MCLCVIVDLRDYRALRGQNGMCMARIMKILMQKMYLEVKAIFNKL